MNLKTGFPAIVRWYRKDCYILAVSDGDDSHGIYNYIDDKDLKDWFSWGDIERIRQLREGEGMECRVIPHLSPWTAAEIKNNQEVRTVQIVVK